jgi:hypothetical protein
MDQAARAYLATYLTGRPVLLMAADWARCRELSARIRDDLIHLGLVDGGPAIRIADGAEASAGDLNTGAQGGRARNSPRADACGDGAVRCFSPILYSIDTVIPLISLDQRSTWYPDTQVPGGELVLWLLNLTTILGWLLSSIFVLSLARLSRST